MNFYGLKRFTLLAALFFALITPYQGFAQSSPTLNFSDLISGPATGLGDGKGSGAIVTIWGQYLGDTQGSSSLIFKDANGTEHTPYIYYWKRADGQLPGGPANLYASHRMQEIAFSIPNSATGEGTIRVTTSSGSDTLPFTVRSGKIYHVKPTGNDSNPGTFASPLLTADGAQSINASSGSAGSIFYFHDVASGSSSSNYGMFWDQAGPVNTLAAQLGIVAYPNTRPTVAGARAFEPYQNTAIVLSKLQIYGSNYSSVDANGQPGGSSLGNTAYCVRGTGNGRIIGNECTDIENMCASGLHGAIWTTGQGADYGSNIQILGNYIHDFACEGSSKFTHTTYISIRDDDTWSAPQMAWNYLKDNDSKMGLHVYDQIKSGECGYINGVLKVHDNVVVNQAGSGIAVSGSGCAWLEQVDVYNNVLINVGGPSSWNGIDPSTSTNASTPAILLWDSGLGAMPINIYNNTVYNWDTANIAQGFKGCFGLGGSQYNVNVYAEDNICYTDYDRYFAYSTDSSSYGILSGTNNFLHYAGTNPVNALIPSQLTNSVTTNPLLTVSGSQISLDADSPLIGTSSTTLLRDIYGTTRGAVSDAGAIQFSAGTTPASLPLPPSNLNIQIQVTE